jgi:hypothetical protein
MKQKIFRDLRADEIEVRVGSIVKDRNGNPKGFQLLLYKTSRTDMAILDETFGTFGWRNRFYQVKNTMVCSIEVYDEETKQWINKDNGGDDDTKMEQVKSELSDSIKRAGSTLGIGRKLYTASKIYMVVNIDEDNTTSSYYQVKEIEYDETSITKLVVINKKTKQVVISYPKDKNNSQNAEKPSLMTNEPITKADVDYITSYIGNLGGDKYNNFFAWLEKKFGTRDFRSLNAEQGKIIVNALKGNK